MTEREKIREILEELAIKSEDNNPVGLFYREDLIGSAFNAIMSVRRRYDEGKIDVTNMTQNEFKEALKAGYINFTVFGYTINELKQIIDFAKSKEFKPKSKR